MGFIDSYKRLEKLCGEIMNDERKISAYIDEMISKPNGSNKVPGWDEDLKKLKHYRWVRNKIAHEPDCTEKNMCEPGDARWLDDFYSRIMNQKDPLALYRKASKTNRRSSVPRHTSSKPSKKRKKANKQNRFIVAFLIFVIIVMLGVIVVIFLDLFDGELIETIYKKFQQFIN